MEEALTPAVTIKHWKDFTWKDWLRVGAGVILLLLGLAGLVLPILQGVLFLILSALLLAPYSRSVQRLQTWAERRFPEVHRKAQALADRLMPWHRH